MMEIGPFAGNILDDIETVVGRTNAEIRVVKEGGIISIFRHDNGDVFFGSGETLESAYASLLRDRSRNEYQKKRRQAA